MATIPGIPAEYHSDVDLRALMQRLASIGEEADECWQGWKLSSLTGGANNRLYRARRDGVDYVVKFTIRDERDRARREYNALSALADFGLRVAPAPVHLDTDSFRYPVVVQTWVEGEVVTNPPESDSDWRALLELYLKIQRVNPGKCPTRLDVAWGNIGSVADARASIDAQLARLPVEARPDSLVDLLDRFGRMEFPDWGDGRVTLCRSDPNVTNFVRNADGWLAVDWEYSGWGDPAFDIADMMSHPRYSSVPASRWEWVVGTYADLARDSTCALRIETYHRAMLVWWVVRSARRIYELSRGIEERLVPPAEDALAETRAQYGRYLDLAEKRFAQA